MRTLGTKVSYKSHSGIIRAETRYFCSLGKEGGGQGRSSSRVVSGSPQQNSPEDGRQEEVRKVLGSCLWPLKPLSLVRIRK